MIADVALTFVDLFVSLFCFLLLVRVVVSYVARPGSGLYAGLVNVTEPVLAPVRKVLPATPGMDLAPLVAFFLLQGVQYLLHLVFGG